MKPLLPFKCDGPTQESKKRRPSYPMLIGLSLSFCVNDIINKKVKMEQVFHIYTGCSPQSEQEFREQVLNIYLQGSFKGNEAMAIEIITRLRDENRIAWLSQWDKSPCPLGDIKHWIETDLSVKEYHKRQRLLGRTSHE